MRTLLIDADVVAYQAAAVCEKAVEFEPGYWTWSVSWDEVLDTFDAKVAEMMDTLGADAFKLCVTDSEENFRLNVHPDYKGNRKSIKKPLILKPFKQYLIDERGAYFRPRLEGDDCMGILATHPKLIKGEKVIVSIDKDMKTIPGPHIRWGAEEQETGIVEISKQEADYWFLYQTLTGDTTDGYKGCPKVGPVAAAAILGTPEEASEYDDFIEAKWPAVVAAYEKAKQTEDDAIIQARCARILRASDYDYQNKRPILWTP
jgi:DNA polymerase-1